MSRDRPPRLLLPPSLFLSLSVFSDHSCYSPSPPVVSKLVRVLSPLSALLRLLFALRAQKYHDDCSNALMGSTRVWKAATLDVSIRGLQ